MSANPAQYRLLRSIAPDQAGVDALLHDVTGPEHQHASRRDGHFLARLGIAPDPLALNQAVEDHRLTEGRLVLMEAMGGGLTWGAALARW